MKIYGMTLEGSRASNSIERFFLEHAAVLKTGPAPTSLKLAELM